jgi:GAF domain-containing protein
MVPAAGIVTGEDARFFASLAIPFGAGSAGRRSIVDRTQIPGEAAYLNDPRAVSKLHSALAVPLATPAGVVGVLALYCREQDAFSGDQCRVLQVVASKLGTSIENAMKYRQAESSATTDYLTSLPNARSLFT